MAIARALANNPPIILADEPTGNLDTDTGRQVIELLMAVNRDRSRTLVLVTHDPALAAFVDEVIALRDGSVVDHKSTPEVDFHRTDADSRQIGGKSTSGVDL